MGFEHELRVAQEELAASQRASSATARQQRDEADRQSQEFWKFHHEYVAPAVITLSETVPKSPLIPLHRNEVETRRRRIRYQRLNFRGWRLQWEVLLADDGHLYKMAEICEPGSFKYEQRARDYGLREGESGFLPKKLDSEHYRVRHTEWDEYGKHSSEASNWVNPRVPEWCLDVGGYDDPTHLVPLRFMILHGVASLLQR